MKQKQVWDEIAEPWSKFRTKPLPEVMKFLKDKKGRVLDLGCGSGRNFVKQKDLEIYGVDFSEKMIEIAEQKNIAAELRLMKREKIPYDNNFFDSVICISVLHCVDSAEKRKKILKELYRVLKSGGRALISVWSKNQSRLKNKEKECQIPWTVDGKKYQRYTYVFDVGELRKLLEDIRFKVLKIWEDENVNVILKKNISNLKITS